MKTSPETVAAIARFEGNRLVPYNDVAGNATVGVGHLLHLGKLNGSEQPITESRSLELFAEDLYDRAEEHVAWSVHVPLSQNQFDALVSFTYNLGPGTLLNLVQETGLNQKNYSSVSPAILKYDKARVHGVLTVLPGLVSRREYESELFSKLFSRS